MENSLLHLVVSKAHHTFRKDHPQLEGLAQTFSAQGLDPRERMTRRFELLASLEEPVLLPEEKIAFLRTVKHIPDCFTQEEWKSIRDKHYIHELGYLSNVSPNYEDIIHRGLQEKYETADPYARRMIDAIFGLTDRYRDEAQRQGKTELAQVLSRVPRQGAGSFYEALQFFRILHFSL